MRTLLAIALLICISCNGQTPAFVPSFDTAFCGLDEIKPVKFYCYNCTYPYVLHLDVFYGSVDNQHWIVLDSTYIVQYHLEMMLKNAQHE